MQTEKTPIISKDKDELNKMWAENKAPWKVWE